MSKSLNILVPALSGTALLLGVAYGVTSRDYGAMTIESLELRAAKSEQTAAQAQASAEAAEAEIQRLLGERDELRALAAAGGGLTTPAPTFGAVLNLGREALPEEIAAWDVDVLPDGRGLPVGSGDVFTGEEVFIEQCAACHGDFAEGAGNWPKLAGGFGTLANEDPVKTIGSYWPYLSTAWDYINRSMPFGNAGTLSADETYAIVAYLLYSNDLVDDDFVLSQENFLEVELPNTGGFVLDDRPEREYAVWRAEPCMTNCKESVEITMHASVVDVTPDIVEEDAAPMVEAAVETQAEPAPEQSGPDPVLIAAGEGVFRQCSACHQVGPSASNRSGPQLNGIQGRAIGSVEGFRYSNALQESGAAGDVWSSEKLHAFLTDPRGAMPGTKMAFRGLKDAADIDALLAYLESAGAE